MRTQIDAGDAAGTISKVETLFHLEMLNQGFYFARRGYVALSLPTTDTDCAGFAAAVDDFLAVHGSLIGEALG